MPNPNRPVFKDVIDDQWGQLVADRIIRRYANAAERNADLAGIIDLTGQVCILTAPVAPKMLLQIHNGTHWVNVIQIPRGGGGSILQVGHLIGFVSVSSLSIVFPEAMDTTSGGPVVTATPTEYQNQFPGAAVARVSVANRSALAFTCTFRGLNGDQYPDGTFCAAEFVAGAATAGAITGPGAFADEAPAPAPPTREELLALPGLINPEMVDVHYPP